MPPPPGLAEMEGPKKKRRVVLSESNTFCPVDSFSVPEATALAGELSKEEMRFEPCCAGPGPPMTLPALAALPATSNWLMARTAKHGLNLAAKARTEALSGGGPAGGGIVANSALAGVDQQHGPCHSDHMAEKMKHPGYYEMRNAKLAENGSKMRDGGLDTHASVYLEMSANAASASGGASTAGGATSRLSAHSAAAPTPNTGGGDRPPPQIFRGVHAYFNGTKGRHSAMHLTKLLQLHGGEAMWMLSKTQTTHLICDGLAAGKTNRMLNSSHRAKNQVYAVRPSWITESIAAGRRLSEKEHRSLVDDSQGTLDTLVTLPQEP